MEGGKRLRPAFVYWGYRGAGGAAGGPQAEAAIRAACSVELLHICALIHDDIMDGSEVRRGRPAMHVGFAGLHRGRAWRGDPAAFGEGAAMLMGDLAFTWADVALAEAGLADDRLAAALRVFNRLRSELMGGQYLDLVEARRGASDEDAVRRVLTYKSGKYTIERPLHLGHALAAGTPDLAREYSAYGLPLGEAFQLRDDILGVFGEPEVTGKPAGDDLREGKETYLVMLARRRAGPAGRDVVVVEAEAVPGGRCGTATVGGYRFDTGPSVLTMPEVVRATVGAAGEELEDWLELDPLDPIYRIGFHDGSRLDVVPGAERMAAEVERLAGPE